jgi:hypothetical protein
MNRDAILNINDSIKPLLRCLSGETIKYGYGACLNITMDNELVQSEFVEQGFMAYLSETLLQFNNCDYFDAFIIALRVLGNIVESDIGLDHFFKSTSINYLTQVVNDINSIILEIHCKFKNQSFIDSIEVEFYVDCMDSISVLLETIAEDDKGKVEFISHPIALTVMDFIDLKFNFTCDSIEKLTELGSIKMLLAKSFTLCTMDDKIMKKLCNDYYIQRFISWTEYDVENRVENDHVVIQDIRMSGALCFGNIARSGKYN